MSSAGWAVLHFPALAAQSIPFFDVGIMPFQRFGEDMSALAIGDEVIISGLFGI